MLTGQQIVDLGLVKGITAPSQIRPHSVRLTLGEVGFGYIAPGSGYRQCVTAEAIDTTEHQYTGIFSPTMSTLERGWKIEAPIWDAGYKGYAHVRVDFWHGDVPAVGDVICQVAFI